MAGNASLASLDTKTPTLGQALAAASTPVVLTAAQQTALTPPAAITGFSTEATVAALNEKIPAQGQALAAASVPVVLTAIQAAAIAPPLSGGAVLTTPLGWTPGHSSASGTTTYDTGPGVFHAVTINSLGTVASTVTVYDNTAGSGTVLAVIDSLTLKGQFVYDLAYAVGLTIVVTGTAAPDVSVAYR